MKRIAGCVSAIKNAGISVPKSHIKYCNFQRERALSAVMELLNSANPPDAFFSVNDRGAIEIIKLLEERGLKVPEQIGVAGFGNEPMSSYIFPSLTTIVQHPFNLGELAAEIIIQEITAEVPVKIQNHIINPELIVRKSTLRQGT
ncbi:LacI family DNA-binding transcriptional regulator [Pedobacter immunditicola]|uniref:LacI family DNA-binding transcriptional regulator n=1 Tax=Pedobacter immunditicola TaxID=3133440 RepID=UPI0030A69C6C